MTPGHLLAELFFAAAGTFALVVIIRSFRGTL